MKKIFFYIFLTICLPFSALSQRDGLMIAGKLIDKITNEPLVGANVILKNLPDSSIVKGISTDVSGRFMINGLKPGSYFIEISYIGYKSFKQTINLEPPGKFYRELGLELDAKALEAVSVETMAIRTIQRNDTTEINADAYKVNRDATTEDLVSKMPGITVENGQVKAQGEDVRRVLVDGREFFGDDASAALRNLPAEIVDRVQIFDRMSDQSAFTGFNDGNTQKTMNILTRPGMNQGQFGKFYAGGGTDNRYAGGFSLNHFNGAHRFTIIGQSNNINQQNFTTQDLIGALGAGGVNTRWMGMQGMMRGPGGRGGGGGWNPMGQLSNFMVNNQGGINTTNALGINYSGKWNKVNLSASYFANRVLNETESFVDRTTFLGGANQNYLEQALSGNTNINHRINLRLEYNIDSNNAIIFTPVLSTQSNKASNLFNGLTTMGGMMLNTTNSNTNAENAGYNFNGNLLYRYKFSKPRRTVTFNVGAVVSDQDGFTSLLSNNLFLLRNDTTNTLIDQNTDNWSLANTYSFSANYTEPLGKNSMLQFNYSPSVRYSTSERKTMHRLIGSDFYTELDAALSNNFKNVFETQRGGVSYRFGKEKYNFGIGLDAQFVQLGSNQTFPRVQDVNIPFRNLLPNANLQYTFSKQSNIRVFYRTSTNAPTVNQLQNVVNNTNPLLLTAGNANLKQSFNHNIFTRFMLSKPEKGSSFFALLNTSITEDFIATATYVATQDSVIDEGLVLGRGAQLNKPVNLNGNYMIRTFLTYGRPLAKGKFNINVLAGITHNATPGLVNGVKNMSSNTNYNSGFVLASNISKEVDFKISYSANYNAVTNTIQAQLNNNFFSHAATVSGNYLPKKWLVLNTEITQTQFSGLNADFDQRFLLWNAGIGYKFMKNQMAELRLTAFDLLGQNNSLNRNVTETYVEDNQTQVLTRYFMLTFTYNLRRFKGLGELMQKQIETPSEGGERERKRN